MLPPSSGSLRTTRRYNSEECNPSSCFIFIINIYCDVHAVARFRGNKGGYLGNDYWMFPWNPFQESVFSAARPEVIYSG
jgi:hypothetical protein